MCAVCSGRHQTHPGWLHLKVRQSVTPPPGLLSLTSFCSNSAPRYKTGMRRMGLGKPILGNRSPGGLCGSGLLSQDTWVSPKTTSHSRAQISFISARLMGVYWAPACTGPVVFKGYEEPAWACSVGGALVAKADNLNSIPRAFMAEEITDTHRLCLTHTLTYNKC